LKIYVKYLIITFLEIYATLLGTVITLVLANGAFYSDFLYRLMLLSFYLLKITLPPYLLYSLIHIFKERRKSKNRVVLAKKKFL